VSFLNTQLDSILIGKFIGVSELGVYDVFKRIVQQPIRLLSPIIQKVTYPLMAKVHEDKERVTNMFTKILELLNTIRFPILLGIALVAPEITSLFLGAAWANNYVVLQVLALVFAFRTIQSFIAQAMLASGKANWGFYNNLVMLPINLITIYIGSFWGILGISITLFIQSLLIIIPRYYYIVRPLFQISLKEFTSLIFKDLLIVFTIILLIFYSVISFEMQNLYAIVIKSFFFSFLYLGYLFFFKKNTLKYIKYLISK
jgi:O-antigen/teichoic acid export membrane protein